MKAINILIAVFIFSCTTNSNQDSQISVTENQIPEGAILQDYQSIAGLQKVVVMNNDRIAGEGDFLDGKYHGSWTSYDDQGKVKQITTYLNGLKQGTELIFDNQGYVSKNLIFIMICLRANTCSTKEEMSLKGRTILAEFSMVNNINTTKKEL